MPDRIPFNRPHVTGAETAALLEAVAGGVLSGNGPFSQRCAEWIRTEIGGQAALVVPSCTAALEMAVMLAGVGPGDEVIMPSFTFVSTANAVALRGGVPVFADVAPDTLNLDPERVAEAITERTKAVICVHYAGVGCDMDALVDLCERHSVLLIEDAAHCIRAWYRDRPLGSFGALSTFSFHETKNVQCGEGGALVINDPSMVEAAEILQEKGTNRRRFLRGQVDKYTWVEVGSSYLMSDVSAAFLWAQLQHAAPITERRLEIWRAYRAGLADLEEEGLLQLPTVPEDRTHNAHLFHVRLPDLEARTAFIAALAEQDVQSVFHYVPLHDAPAGQRLARAGGPLDVTEREAARLARLPLWVDMTTEDVARVIDAVHVAARAVAAAPR
jgi:dTDP-4-amino-4,6-dideoxygalactose transaminase